MVIALRADQPETVKYLSTLEGAEEALPAYQLLYDLDYILTSDEWEMLTGLLECTIAELLTTAILYEFSENVAIALERAKALGALREDQIYELFNLTIDNHNYHAYDALLQYAKLSEGEKPVWIRTGAVLDAPIVTPPNGVALPSFFDQKVAPASGDIDFAAATLTPLTALLTPSGVIEDDTKPVEKFRSIPTDLPVGISHDTLMATVNRYIEKRNREVPLDVDAKAAINFVSVAAQSKTDPLTESKIILTPFPTSVGASGALSDTGSIYSREDVIRQLALSQDKRLLQLAGPVNVLLEIIGNDTDECARLGGCRMLVCRHMNDDDDGNAFEAIAVGGTTTGSGRRAVTTASDVGTGDDWFTGLCDICGVSIHDRRWAIRMALAEGGWQGCFDREQCLRAAIRQQSRSKAEIEHLDKISDNTMSQLLEFGIIYE